MINPRFSKLDDAEQLEIAEEMYEALQNAETSLEEIIAWNHIEQAPKHYIDVEPMKKALASVKAALAKAEGPVQ